MIGLDRLEIPTPQNDPTSEIKLTELAERVEHARIDRSLNYLLKTIENNWAL